MSPKEHIEERKRDYQLCFGSPAGKKVLEDLARFCFISTLDEDAYARGDPNETMMRLGCQKVFRHITMHLSLTTENLMSIYFPVRTRSDDGNSTGYPGGPSSSP